MRRVIFYLIYISHTQKNVHTHNNIVYYTNTFAHTKSLVWLGNRASSSPEGDLEANQRSPTSDLWRQGLGVAVVGGWRGGGAMLARAAWAWEQTTPLKSVRMMRPQEKNKTKQTKTEQWKNDNSLKSKWGRGKGCQASVVVAVFKKAEGTGLESHHPNTQKKVQTNAYLF